MTLQEKIAQTPKLERIDSSIESCIKILEQELEKRRVEDPGPKQDYIINQIQGALKFIKNDFNIMKNKK